MMNVKVGDILYYMIFEIDCQKDFEQSDFERTIFRSREKASKILKEKCKRGFTIFPYFD